MPYALIVKPGTKVKLSDYPTNETAGLNKEAAHDLEPEFSLSFRDVRRACVLYR